MDFLAVGEFVGPERRIVIEEHAGEHDPAFPVDDQPAPVAEPRILPVIAEPEGLGAGHRGRADSARGRFERLVVGRLGAVFEAVAVVGKGRMNAAVVFLQGREIGIRDPDQLVAGAAGIGRLDAGEVRPRGHQIVGIGEAARLLADNDVLHLGDLAVRDLEPETEDRRYAVLLDHGETADAAALRLGDEIAIGPDLGRDPPDAVGQVELLAVLGVFRARGDRRLGRVMGHHGREILLDEAEQALPVAGLRRSGRAARQCGQDQYADNAENDVLRVHGVPLRP